MCPNNRAGTSAGHFGHNGGREGSAAGFAAELALLLVVDGRADAYEDRYRPYAYGESADFNIRSFRTTNVLRWEYRPGSSLFLVWQQGKQDDQNYGDFRFGRDFSGVFSAPSRNVFLIKFSYWLNM